MSLGREILRRSAIYSGAATLEKFVSLLLLPFYAAIFETEGYGIIGMVDVGVGVLTIALSAGYYNAIVTTYHEEPREGQGRVISTAIILQCLLALATIPVPMLLSPWVSQVLLGDSSHAVIIMLALATMVVDLTGVSASSDLLIRGKPVLYSTIGLLRFVSAISLNILLVLVLRVGLVGIFISSFVSAVLSAGALIWTALRTNGVTFDRQIARRLFTFQLPLVPAELVAFCSRQSERVLVRLLIGLDSVGVLEMAYKFPPLLNWLVVSPFMMAWRTKSVEIGAQPDAPYAMGRMLTNMVFVLLLAGTLLGLSVEPLIVLLTPKEFWRAASIARVEIVTTILAALVMFMHFGLIYTRRTGRLAVIRTSVALTKATISVVMIRRFGLGGAAYSGLLMEAVTVLWLFRESQRAYKIHIEYAQIAFLTSAAAALWILGANIERVPMSPAAWVASAILPTAHNILGATPLAGWRSGKLMALMDEKAMSFATLLINMAVAASFAPLLLIVRPEAVRVTLRRLLRIARLTDRSSRSGELPHA